MSSENTILVDDLIDHAPTPDVEQVHDTTFSELPTQPESVPIETPAAAENQGGTDEIDSAGQRFDPAIHYRKNGQPVLTPTGKFRKRRAGSTSTDETGQPVGEVNLMSITARPGAIMLVESCITINDVYGSKLFGEYWATTPQEKQLLVDAWSKFVTYKNWDTGNGIYLPLFLATLPYIISRCTDERFTIGLMKIKNSLLRKKDNARTNHRDNGMRQNDTGENTGAAMGGPQGPVSDI